MMLPPGAVHLSVSVVGRGAVHSTLFLQHVLCLLHHRAHSVLLHH